MSSDESDLEINSALPKKASRAPKSPTVEILKSQETKKLSTKEMIHNALSGSKSRKGLSLYAIKKYMQDNYNVDIEKVNYLIKKYIKESVEAGTIIQTRGVGASGSFRLPPGSKQPKKTEKKQKKGKETSQNEENMEKPQKSSTKNADVPVKPKTKVTKPMADSKSSKTDDNNTKKSKNAKEKPPKANKTDIDPKPGGSNMKTPKKRSNMMRRKSIGSIIKPPRMKPSAK